MPTHRARMNALHKARKHMSDIMAKARLDKASKTRVRAASDRHIDIGNKVLLYRDNPGKWVSPYTVIDIEH